MTTPTLREGGCLCGRVRFAARGDSLTNVFCHCRSCRRAAGAPVVAWAMYPLTQVTFSGDPPARYQSSPGAVRSFCARCGTTLAYEGELIPGLIDVTVASFDDPTPMTPDIHIWCRHRLPWVAVAEDAVTYDELPAGPPPG